tara:strand:- start:13588 stop:13980 length:393 start_codon:yes stop_codon:yes gene_type:complete
MSRTTYKQCKFCGDFHDVHNWPDNHREWVPDNRSELAAPMLINDNLDYVESQADGKRYTSKRALSAEYRRLGYVEVGNENPGAHRKTLDKKKHRAEVKESIQRAASTVSLKKPTMTPKQVRKARRKMANG